MQSPNEECLNDDEFKKSDTASFANNFKRQETLINNDTKNEDDENDQNIYHDNLKIFDDQ